MFDKIVIKITASELEQLIRDRVIQEFSGTRTVESIKVELNGDITVNTIRPPKSAGWHDSMMR